MRHRLAAAALALLASAAHADEAISASATLHLRTTNLSAAPSTAIRFDRETRAFALDDYLATRGRESWASAYASLLLDGRLLGGDLRWALAVDTGELRRRRFPRIAEVCLSEQSPTGLDVAESGRCRGGSPIYPLPETRLSSPRLAANGRPFRDEVEETLLVREAYAAWSFGRAGLVTARAGRKRLTVGDGHVYDDYATGAELEVDLGAIGPRWDLSLAVFQPTRDLPGSWGATSPMAAAHLDFLPSLFEHAGVFAAAIRDRGGGTAEIMRGALAERLVSGLLLETPGTNAYQQRSRDLARTLAERLQGDAVLWWLGTSGSLVPARGQRVSWTAAALGGEVRHITSDDPAEALLLAEHVALRGRMASLRYEADLGPRVGASAFLLYQSGGGLPGYGAGEPVRGTYRGFLGVAPYVTTTNLFFGGGLSESFAARQVSAPGVNGRGVIAPGLGVVIDPAEGVSIEARGAWLAAAVRGPFGGRIYGTELDLDLTWSPRPWLLLGAELDVLFPGDFFAGGRTVHKSILALDLLTP